MVLLSQLIFAGAAFAGSLLVRQDQCTSDDACKEPCSAPSIVAQGVNVTPNEKVQAEARRRFQDAHCIDKKCSCAITSDDQAQDFCKYWIENAKEEFGDATYVNGGVDADKGSIYCVYTKPA
ncbi:hypothetical protein PRZ48_002128 [Zasmidium cellare]|uniref:Uncharacterized protein n=1 Tax=Zasmidium cellare TaxID=395010 RepID=A0ABR0F4T2_ZASCE|nr:hypothetical protein PRZ48_002128 [Zasmidium cellare]